MAGSLRRTLSLRQVSLSRIGVILGAGVYALIGPAAAQAGNALWLSFLLAGLTAGLTAFAYAAMTDAAVLVSFMFVNASLPWLAARRRTPARGPARAVEVLLPSLAFLLCAWLLLHAGVTSLVAALGLSAVMLPAASRTLTKSRTPGYGQTP